MIKKILILLLVITVSSCVKEGYFGYSSYGNIKDLVVSNQAKNAVIDTENFSVEIEIPGGVDLSTITIQSLELSSFATSNKNIGDVLDLNEPAQIQVVAEDGSVYNWTVTSFVASVTPQIDNYDLNLWYKTASGYYEPGADANTTVWGTGNPGTQILNKLATTPFDFGNGNYGAKLETLDNGKLAGTFGAPISAGSIFTGKFDSDKIDPSNPQAAIDFGIPFVGRPAKLRLKYKFSPGAVNKNKQGDVLAYPDMLDIYALLEIRFSGKIQRLGTAWLRSSDGISELNTVEIPFNYGELNNSFPDYMKPVDGVYVSQDSAQFVLPTHITFVASSSFDGANFAGAIGSTLIIDDVEMVYDEE